MSRLQVGLHDENPQSPGSRAKQRNRVAISSAPVRKAGDAAILIRLS